MKKTILVTLTALFCIYTVCSQNIIRAKPITEIFADFHYFPDNDSSTTTGFAVNRAYLGCNFTTDTRFTGSVIVNVANPSELAPGAKSRRVAYFREASVTWNGDRLTLSGGMTTTKGTIFQQRFIGKRYVAENFEALDGYISVADLGFTVEYKINDRLKADMSLMNGEGYSELHLDNSIRGSVGLTIVPLKNTVIRLYGDMDRPGGIRQNMLLCFIGYKNNRVNLAAEVAGRTSLDKIPGHNAWGFSSTCSVKIFEKTELFGRFDHTASKTVPNEDLPWNYDSDRQFAVTGIQYSFTDAFRIALDYQGIFPSSPEFPYQHGIYLNAHFRLLD
ncbi:MAG TPA: hypothetical protein VK155_04285 [Bacteroidales bacterium]|jgi:hypothetical protein|nr:hypothetical protein [Bacteroidales bacterium]